MSNKKYIEFIKAQVDDLKNIGFLSKINIVESSVSSKNNSFVSKLIEYLSSLTFPFSFQAAVITIKDEESVTFAINPVRLS